MMEMTLRYVRPSPAGQFAVLSAVGLVLAACTHAYPSTTDPAVPWVPKIPPGEYKCVRGIHTLAHSGPFETFEITGIDGHSGIVFHVGNWPQVDSDGCVLLGIREGTLNGQEAVLASDQAFRQFMQYLAHEDEFMLTVVASA